MYVYVCHCYISAGLFEPEHVAQELAFKAAIEKMNLHQVVGSSRMIVYHVEHTTAHDSFEANKEGESHCFSKGVISKLLSLAFTLPCRRNAMLLFVNVFL
jgi:hypothetical protein